jgi:hypothetical protein
MPYVLPRYQQDIKAISQYQSQLLISMQCISINLNQVKHWKLSNSHYNINAILTRYQQDFEVISQYQSQSSLTLDIAKVMRYQRDVNAISSSYQCDNSVSISTEVYIGHCQMGNA